MTTDQQNRYNVVRSYFPDKQKREYGVVRFDRTTREFLGISHVRDLAEARNAANGTRGDEVEIYRFDGAILWLLAAE